MGGVPTHQTGVMNEPTFPAKANIIAATSRFSSGNYKVVRTGLHIKDCLVNTEHFTAFM